MWGWAAAAGSCHPGRSRGAGCEPLGPTPWGGLRKQDVLGGPPPGRCGQPQPHPQASRALQVGNRAGAGAGSPQGHTASGQRPCPFYPVPRLDALPDAPQGPGRAALKTQWVGSAQQSLPPSPGSRGVTQKGVHVEGGEEVFHLPALRRDHMDSALGMAFVPYCPCVHRQVTSLSVFPQL